MLPEVESPIPISEMLVDQTPDGKYAVRILQTYRRRCDIKWKVSGLSKERTAMYDVMNKHQLERAAELDRAIEILEQNL